VVQTVAYVQYAKPEAAVQRTVNRVRLFLAFGVVGGTLLAFLGGIWVARRAMRPIAGLTRAAREVARTRDPDITLPAPRANDEVADLAHTFEDMLRELSEAHDESEAALARQREFVADASHELRTPLTSILANLELLETELQGEQREMAGSALRSSRRMRRLVADLLLLARADAGREATMAPVDLAAIAREAAAEAGALSADHPISLDAPDRVTVTGVADDLHRLAGNLVENALIHTPAGTPVTVSVRREGSDAVLEVADRGPGVPPEMRERVFERFARTGGDGTRRGSGLGLAIVRRIIAEHGGAIDAADNVPSGTIFTIELPV
jgi:signal transduction histidine kinase